jgi:hypothetical protein
MDGSGARFMASYKPDLQGVIGIAERLGDLAPI